MDALSTEAYYASSFPLSPERQFRALEVSLLLKNREVIDPVLESDTPEDMWIDTIQPREYCYKIGLFNDNIYVNGHALHG